MSPNIPEKYQRRVPYNIHEKDEHRGVKLYAPFPSNSPLARFDKQDEAALIELVYQNVLHEKGQREVNQAFKQALSHKKKNRMAIAEEFCKIHGVPVDNVAELTPEAKNVMRVPNEYRMQIFVMLCIITFPLVTAIMWVCGWFDLVPDAEKDGRETVGVLFASWRAMGGYMTAASVLALIHGLWVKHYTLRETVSLDTDQGIFILTSALFGGLGLLAIGIVWLFWVSIIPWVIVFGGSTLVNLIRGANR
ncbi:MAG: hypothetical protein K2F78_01725 [Muribaculaceae bacterium]|nr:hypothetical protein [Muribaculaceae bacterium]